MGSCCFAPTAFHRLNPREQPPESLQLGVEKRGFDGLLERFLRDLHAVRSPSGIHHWPPACHRPLSSSPRERAVRTGPAKNATRSTHASNPLEALMRFFETKASHCRCLLASIPKRLVSPTGVATIGVFLLANVSRIAWLIAAPSNSRIRANSAISKKSFIRLFASPRSTIAWSFSAIEVSGW